MGGGKRKVGLALDCVLTDQSDFTEALCVFMVVVATAEVNLRIVDIHPRVLSQAVCGPETSIHMYINSTHKIHVVASY